MATMCYYGPRGMNSTLPHLCTYNGNLHVVINTLSPSHNRENLAPAENTGGEVPAPGNWNPLSARNLTKHFINFYVTRAGNFFKIFTPWD